MLMHVLASRLGVRRHIALLHNLQLYYPSQRQRGHTNENPTVSEFLKNTQSLRVINLINIRHITGNCQGSKRKTYDLESAQLNLPLKKRKRHHSH